MSTRVQVGRRPIVVFLTRAVRLNFMWALVLVVLAVIATAVQQGPFAGAYSFLIGVVMPVFLWFGLLALPINLVAALVVRAAGMSTAVRRILPLVTVSPVWFAIGGRFFAEPNGEFMVRTAIQFVIQGAGYILALEWLESRRNRHRVAEGSSSPRPAGPIRRGRTS